MIMVNGVWIRRRGGEDDPHAVVEVYVELGDGWHKVIEEPLSANFSTCAGVQGIMRSHRVDFEPEEKPDPDAGPVLTRAEQRDLAEQEILRRTEGKRVNTRDGKGATPLNPDAVLRRAQG